MQDGRMLPVLVTLLHDMIYSKNLLEARVRADVIADLEINVHDLKFGKKQVKLLAKVPLTVGEYFSLALARFPLHEPTERLCANVLALFNATKNFGFVPGHKIPGPTDRLLEMILPVPESSGEETAGKVTVSAREAPDAEVARMRALALAALEGAERTVAELLNNVTEDPEVVQFANELLQKTLKSRKELMDLFDELTDAVLSGDTSSARKLAMSLKMRLLTIKEV